MAPIAVVLVVGIVAVFIALFVSLSAIAAFDNEARGVSKSLAVIEAFSAAPAAMKKELDPSFNDRVLTPLLNKFVGLGRKLTPADHTDRIRQKIDAAGNPPGWTVDRVHALKVVGFGAMLLLSILLTYWLGSGLTMRIGMGVTAALIGYFGPNLYLYQKTADRADIIRRTFPDSMDLLTISVEAGLGFDAALSHVARNTEGPLAHEFSRVLQEMQIGLGRSQALRALADRTTVPEMRGFASAMVQADAFGIPIGKVLRVQSAEIRVKRRQRAEERAQKLPVKLLFPMILFILPCLFIIILGPAVISIVTIFSGNSGL
jgi:tight adherence protein C